MALEKIVISPERGAPITALFNPERYTLSKAAQFAEIAIPGLDAPVVQFVRGQSEKITLDLFFDTTEFGMVENVKDVRTETSKVYAMLRVNGETHAPLRCILRWGEGGRLFAFGTRVSPWCVVESVNGEFSLFSPGGVPLRAKLTVTFRDAWTVEEQVRETPRHSADRTKVRTVQRGQTLSYIAWLEYQDPQEWRRIAEANALDNPRRLLRGTTLRIPRGTPEIA